MLPASEQVQRLNIDLNQEGQPLCVLGADTVLTFNDTTGPFFELTNRALTGATELLIHPARQAIPSGSLLVLLLQNEAVYITTSDDVAPGETHIPVEAIGATIQPQSNIYLCQDIEDYSLQFLMKDHPTDPDSEALLDFSIGEGIEILDPSTNGAMQLTIPRLSTVDADGNPLFPGAVYSYVLRRTDSGFAYPLALGQMVWYAP